ncbi:hypothetical protein D9757_012226 [Collybiopsis confluens]|uniref:Uncharacterized protein n=1 Tax=Collybiopsis confluens TaxID=2823264 RepID=A0A8H5LRU3_9AGAR|nr:hypothetical protein D9757_012226 [Collybiopsis confluens]
MAVAKRFLVAVSAVLFGDQVLAIPQTITFPHHRRQLSMISYRLKKFPSSKTPQILCHSMAHMRATATILGVSSGSDGESETTYSLGRYLSVNEVLTVTLHSQGQEVTQTVTDLLFANTLNWTLVESSGGEWETISPDISIDSTGEGTLIVGGVYASCSFESGHQSAVCNGWDLEPYLTTVTSGSRVATATEVVTIPVSSYEGMMTAYTGEIQGLPVETGSSKSNSELGRIDLYWLSFGAGLSLRLF